MPKLLFPLFVLILASCASEPCDCSEVKEQLKEIVESMPVPLDLPERKPLDSEYTGQDQITAIILENNNYAFEIDDVEYNWEDYNEKLGEKLSESDFSIRKVKIAGHKYAHYESVFRVLAFCQANELEPVLAYDE